MKTILTIVLLVIAGSAFSSNYEEAMKTNIDKMHKATGPAELTELANRFERIANAEPDKWLPGYYAAYCFTSSTFFDGMEADDKQKQLDKAQAIIDGLLKKYINESEIYTLQALVYQLRITDMSKGYKYSTLSHETIDRAEQLDPDNPRVYYLRGCNIFHTPKFFGGGAEKAKPELEKAAKMFATYQPKNDLMPNWGSEHNMQLLSQCNAEQE